MAIFVVQSCTQNEISVPKQEVETELPELNFESTTTPLTEDDPILLALKTSDDVKHYNIDAGELVWDMATIITYDSQETLPLILVPIDSGKEEVLSMFVAAYNEDEVSFHSFINNFDLPSLESEEEGYTGTVEYKTIEDISVIETVFESGELVLQQEFDIDEIALRGVDIKCWLNCMRPYGIANALSGLNVWCGFSTSCCISAPYPGNFCCITLAACALYQGGVAGYCAWKCWK